MNRADLIHARAEEIRAELTDAAATRADRDGLRDRLPEQPARSNRMRAWRIRVVADDSWELFVPARSKSAAIRRAIASVRAEEGLPDLRLRGEVITEGP